MSLEQSIMTEMKEAMKARNEAALRSLRGIKAEIIKEKQNRGPVEKFLRTKKLVYYNGW